MPGGKVEVEAERLTAGFVLVISHNPTNCNLRFAGSDEFEILVCSSDDRSNFNPPTGGYPGSDQLLLEDYLFPMHETLHNDNISSICVQCRGCVEGVSPRAADN